MTVHLYDETFFDYIERGARQSARIATARIRDLFDVTSVLDVGCGRGIWLAEWLRQGVSDVMGLDGDYVRDTSLAVPSQHFRAVDLSQPIDLGRRYDLVYSLEVAEHLKPEAAETFIASLVRHGDVVMFSAARPGQGGEHHVNERPYEYWRGLFRRHGYRLYDCIRPLINDSGVEPWYRYNSFLFVAAGYESKLPASVRATRAHDDEPVAEVAPWWWRARCQALRLMPRNAVEYLALVKHLTLLQLRRLRLPPEDTIECTQHTSSRFGSYETRRSKGSEFIKQRRGR